VGVSNPAERRVLRSPLLRATLAMPLLYGVLVSLPPGRFDSLIADLLHWFPVAIWSLALVLLLLGGANRTLWRVVCVGGVAVAAWGILLVVVWAVDGLAVWPHDYLNEDLVFGLYLALLGLLQGWGAARRMTVRSPART
jgi:hypothetical protein